MSSYKEKIGARIRQERISRNMSIDELAEILHLSSAFIGLIERGQRGIKINNLVKIADIFGLTINDFIYDEETITMIKEPKYNELEESKRSAIISLLHGLNERELDFVITVIKELKDIRKMYGTFAENLIDSNYLSDNKTDDN